MRQALILVDEIQRKKVAIGRTRSERLKNDYTKSIKSDLKELREYCKYKGLDYRPFQKLIREY